MALITKNSFLFLPNRLWILIGGLHWWSLFFNDELFLYEEYLRLKSKFEYSWGLGFLGDILSVTAGLIYVTFLTYGMGFALVGLLLWIFKREKITD